MYDSREDTIAHIKKVQDLLTEITEALQQRGIVHDQSKLEEPEKSLFDEFTPKLRGTTYGSPEYKEMMVEMKAGIEHHDKKNRHHPEFHEFGISGMNLVDVVEMFCDWKAASLRHADGDIRKSITINEERFSLNPQLAEIFRNTVTDFGW